MNRIWADDINGDAHEISVHDLVVRPSVYGVLIEGGQILVQRHPEASKYGIPGGGVEIDESIKDALVREYKEETGLDIQVTELLGVEDTYFYGDKGSFKVIVMLYRVEKIGGKLLKDGNGQDTAEVLFVPLEELKDEELQPIFIKMNHCFRSVN